MSYMCECGWNPFDVTDLDSPELFYYIENGEAIPIRESWVPSEDYEKDGSMSINYEKIKEIFRSKGVKVYPVRKDGGSIVDYYSGVSGFAWNEVHCCPNCNEEFEFDNSTI